MNNTVINNVRLFAPLLNRSTPIGDEERKHALYTLERILKDTSRTAFTQGQIGEKIAELETALSSTKAATPTTKYETLCEAAEVLLYNLECFKQAKPHLEPGKLLHFPDLTHAYIMSLIDGNVDETREKLLGRGGQGEVTQCRLNGEHLAKKEPCSDRENIALLTANHPNIAKPRLITKEATYFNVGERLENGLLTAESLRQHVQGLFSGIAHLHERGMIHRDLKKENILLVDGKVQIIDLGLMAEVDALKADGQGTVQFIAPEVAQTASKMEGAKALSTQIDTYGLGMILFEILSSDRQPYGDHFDRNGMVAAMQIACKMLRFKGFNDLPDLIGRLDADETVRLDPKGTLRKLMVRCLRFDPKQRPLPKMVIL